MNLKTITYTAITSIAIMFGIKSILNAEKLVTEDGTVSATTLPLDQETAKVKYHTATFGMG